MTHKDDRVRELFDWVQTKAADGVHYADLVTTLPDRARKRCGLTLRGAIQINVDNRVFAFEETDLIIWFDHDGWHCGEASAAGPPGSMAP